ncbi:MAG TPA: UDP-glucose 4-epimerase GalE [Alphaproteobacteria bacterium]
MGRNILVTGGAGYIGSHVAKALAAAGFTPVVLDDFRAGHREAVRWGPFVEGDLLDRPLVERTLAAYEVAAVIHLAGSIEVGESVREPARFYRNNFVGILTLLEAMRTAGVATVVFSSTAAVYGEPERVPIPENHPTRPVNPYGQSKLMAEWALAAMERAHGLRWMALRYFNASGADPDGEIGEDHQPESHLIPRACLAALGHLPPLDIYGTDYPTPDGTAIRDYVHVTDLAQAHVRALEVLMAGGACRALNLGVGRGHSVAEVLRAVERVAGRKVPARFAPRRAGDPPVLVADPAAAFDVLGWRAAITDIDAIVSSAWRWHVRRHGQR